jgi:hypothetical protein
MDASPADTRVLVQQLCDLLGLSGHDRPGDPVPTHLAYSDVLPVLRSASSLVLHREEGSAAPLDQLAYAVSRLGRLGPAIAVLAAGGALPWTVVDAYHALIRKHSRVLEDWQAVAGSASTEETRA